MKNLKYPWVVADIDGNYIVMRNTRRGIPMVTEDLFGTEMDAQAYADHLNEIEGIEPTKRTALLWPRDRDEEE